MCVCVCVCVCACMYVRVFVISTSVRECQDKTREHKCSKKSILDIVLQDLFVMCL